MEHGRAGGDAQELDAREYEIALPAELSADARRELAFGLAREISERHGVAVDVSIHAPGREGDQRNHHAHLLTTTRRLGPEGLGEKTRELDQKQSGEVERWRGDGPRCRMSRLSAPGSTRRSITAAMSGADRAGTHRAHGTERDGDRAPPSIRPCGKAGIMSR
jgi:hypothetical protein